MVHIYIYIYIYIYGIYLHFNSYPTLDTGQNHVFVIQKASLNETGVCSLQAYALQSHNKKIVFILFYYFFGYPC